MMGARAFRMAAGAASVSVVGLTLSGCLIHSSSRSSYSGTFVSDTTMRQITPGTTSDFVLATLGPPTSRSTLDDGSEIWRWQWRQSRASDGRVFLLINANSQTDRTATAFVHMQDNVVVKAWRD